MPMVCQKRNASMCLVPRLIHVTDKVWGLADIHEQWKKTFKCKCLGV